MAIEDAIEKRIADAIKSKTSIWGIGSVLADEFGLTCGRHFEDLLAQELEKTKRWLRSEIAYEIANPR